MEKALISQRSRGFIDSTKEVNLKAKVSNEVLIPYLEVDLACKDEAYNGRLPVDILTIGPKHDKKIARLGLKYALIDWGYYCKIAQSAIPVNKPL